MERVDDLEESHFFEKAEGSSTRGHSKKLRKKHSRTQLRRNSFSNRTTTPWNSLPEAVVSSKTLNTFKGRLEKWWRDDPQKYHYQAEWRESPIQTSHEARTAFSADVGEAH